MALIAWIIASLISGTLGSMIVLRHEPNVTHAISNILFLGIVTSFFFAGNYFLFGIIFAILGIALMWGMEKFTPTSRESSKEILSQIWLAAGIFLVGFLGNMQLDVFNFLFWNILFVEMLDIYVLLGMGILGWVLWIFFRKALIRTTLSPEIARSQGINTSLIEFGYQLYLALFIACSVKIFWVLLLGAFLVLPGNIWKILSPNFYCVLVIATIASIVSVISGLFLSYYADTSAGSSIVLILGTIFLAAWVLKKLFRQK